VVITNNFSQKVDSRLGISPHGGGYDDSLKRFFEAIPGIFNSNLVKDLESGKLFRKFNDALGRFLVRT